MRETTILTISTIALTIILIITQFFLDIPTLMHIGIAIIAGLLFGLAIRKQNSKTSIIFSTSILTTFFSYLIYLTITVLLNTLEETSSLPYIMNIMSLPPEFTPILYLIGLNSYFIIHSFKKKESPLNQF